MAIIEKWSDMMGPQYDIVVAQLSKFKQVWILIFT